MNQSATLDRTIEGSSGDPDEVVKYVIRQVGKINVYFQSMSIELLEESPKYDVRRLALKTVERRDERTLTNFLWEGRFRFGLSFSTFAARLFTLVPSIQFYQLLSALGGSLSLYLGLCGVTLLEFGAFIVELVLSSMGLMNIQGLATVTPEAQNEETTVKQDDVEGHRPMLLRSKFSNRRASDNVGPLLRNKPLLSVGWGNNMRPRSC